MTRSFGLRAKSRNSRVVVARYVLPAPNKGGVGNKRVGPENKTKNNGEQTRPKSCLVEPY